MNVDVGVVKGRSRKEWASADPEGAERMPQNAVGPFALRFVQ